jgi:hypothetical protein
MEIIDPGIGEITLLAESTFFGGAMNFLYLYYA